MEPFIGQIILFAGNFAPRGWAKCEGQLLSISENQALFSIVGTMYGGDGRTTFGLPDLRGRTPVGPGQGPGLPNFKPGQKGGSTTNTLTIANLPAHSHALTCSANDGDADDPTGRVVGASETDAFADKPDASMHPDAVSKTGSSSPVNNMQPYQSINYIIALVGTYPSRS